MSVIRSIGWYRPGNTKQVGERILNLREFEAIESLFTPKEGDDWLYDRYLVSTHHGGEIANRVGMKFDFAEYEYYLESWQTEV